MNKYVLCGRVLLFLLGTYARGDFLDPVLVLCFNVAVSLGISTSVIVCICSCQEVALL